MKHYSPLQTTPQGLAQYGRAWLETYQGRSIAHSWSYSVMVITLDFESSDPGSNPGRTFLFLPTTPKVFLKFHWIQVRDRAGTA